MSRFLKIYKTQELPMCEMDFTVLNSNSLKQMFLSRPIDTKIWSVGEAFTLFPHFDWLLIAWFIFNTRTLIFITRKRSCGKVMFSQATAGLQGGGWGGGPMSELPMIWYDMIWYDVARSGRCAYMLGLSVKLCYVAEGTLFFSFSLHPTFLSSSSNLFPIFFFFFF